MGYPVDVQLLGSVQVSAGGAVLALRGARTERLLAALAVNVPRVVSIDRLVDAVWPVSAPATARRQVQDLVSRLRKDLISAGCPDSVVAMRRSGYSLGLPAEAVDASRFREGVAAGRALRDRDPRQAASALRSALGLWRGSALAGLDCPALDADRVGLDELRLAAWEQAIAIELTLGRHDELVCELAVLVERHPSRERLIELYMQALYLAGRKVDALSAFHRVRRLLAAELGLDPGPELRRMHDRIVADDPRLLDRARRPARAPRGPRELPPDVADFTGRPELVLRLGDLLAAAAGPDQPGGRMPVVVVSGPGGIGKTALAVHVAHRLSSQFPGGQILIPVAGTSGAPLRGGDVLAGCLRALAADDHGGRSDAGQLAAALRRRVYGQRILFVFDDVSNLAQIRDSLPASAGCAVLITSRSRLRSWAGATHVQLGPLSAAEASSLFGQIAGARRAEAEPGAVGELLRLCAGLPLAIRISAAQLAAQPDGSVAAHAARLADERQRLDVMQLDELSVRSTFRVGYDSLTSRPGGAAIAAAARRICLTDGPLLGPQAAAALLGGSAADAESALGSLADVSLLQRSAAGQYQFHELVRLFARERAQEQDTEAERADALDRLLAWQLRSACNAAQAISPAHRHEYPAIPAAGEPASFDTPQSALRWFDAELPNLACSVHQAEAAGRYELAWMLTTALWEALDLSGSWSGWIGTHQAALRSTRILGDRYAEAWIRNNLATAYTQLGRGQDACRYLTSALGAVRELGKPAAEATILCNLGNAQLELGELPKALDLYERALIMYKSTGQEHGQSLMLLNIAEVRHLLGQPAAATRCYHESLAWDLGDDRLTGLALSGLGDVSAGQGLLNVAADHYHQALEVHRRIGNRRGQAQTLEGLAAACAATGRHADAQRHRFEAQILRRGLDRDRHLPAR